jgi:hypothetical protein
LWDARRPTTHMTSVQRLRIAACSFSEALDVVHVAFVVAARPSHVITHDSEAG